MTDGQQSEHIDEVMKQREFELKLIQTWSDARYKIASLLLLGNGAAIATVLTFLKDKGPDELAMFVLDWSTMGLVCAGFATLFTWMVTESALGKAAAVDKKDSVFKPLSHWLVYLVFMAAIIGSAGSLVTGLSFLKGWSQATIDIRNGTIKPKE